MNTTGEWWERFFHGPWGRWQAAGIWQGKAEAEADFIVSALGLDPGDEVLDVACGNGRHAVELADKGLEVTGIDFNPAALAVAEAAAAGCDPAPRFIRQDMRCLRFREEFDAAYCFWTSFGYFEDPSHNLVVAKRIAEALRPGGRFLLDLHVTESVLPVFEPESEWEINAGGSQRRLRESKHWNFATGRVEADWTFTENGQSESWHSSIRLYSYGELCELLREAGFSHFEGFDSATGERFTLGAKRLGLVASL
jgi:SAM-dependent methyltransferase